MNIKAFRERVAGGLAANQPQVWGAGQLDEVLIWIDTCERLLVDVAAGVEERECRRTARDLLMELRADK
jgi:hypothetical protein